MFFYHIHLKIVYLSPLFNVNHEIVRRITARIVDPDIYIIYICTVCMYRYVCIYI